MRIFKILILLLVAAFAAEAHEASSRVQVSPLMTKALHDYPDKDAVVLEVVYPPGGGDPVHKHSAHGFIYVLEGEIEMGVRGEKPVTLKPGQTFYEGPEDIHTVGRNTSTTEEAKFLVFLLKNRGEPILTPVD